MSYRSGPGIPAGKPARAAYGGAVSPPGRRRHSRPRHAGRGGPAAVSPAAAGPHTPVTPRELALAVPAGSRRARGQHEFLTRLGEDPDLAQLRADRARNITETARVLARFASWTDRTTRPTRARVCKLAGISVSTFKSARRWLEAKGFLGLVRQGWTAMLRAGILARQDEPNEAAIWVLCVPRKSPRESRGKPLQSPASASDQVTRPLSVSRRDQMLPARDPHRPDQPLDDGTPAGCVRFLRAQVAELGRGPGSKLSERHVLAVSRPFLAARWSPADLAFAIGHDPARGRHRSNVDNVRQPGHWLAWRLSRWCTDPAGAYAAYARLGHWDYDAWPVPALSPAERRAAAAAADAAHRAQVLAPAAAPAPPTVAQQRAAEIRARLGWARPRERT